MEQNVTNKLIAAIENDLFIGNSGNVRLVTSNLKYLLYKLGVKTATPWSTFKMESLEAVLKLS